MNNSARKGFWIYFVLIFLSIIGIGEWLCRAREKEFNPLVGSGYGAASVQYHRLNSYVRKWGPPDCFFIGNSYVQTGIDPDTFSKSFQSKTGKPLKCYNFGMDASTMSSTAPLAMILGRKFHPSLMIIGVQATSFQPVTDIPHEAENRFYNYSWTRYSLGKFDPLGWIIAKSALYRTLEERANYYFAQQNIPPAIRNKAIHPEVRRIFTEAGYAPLIGYRDSSPVYQINNPQNDGVPFRIDAQDFSALEELIRFVKRENIDLVFVEMPFYNPPAYYGDINLQISTYASQQGIPFLSIDGLSRLPATAYSDQTHMHISGSLVFSQWLGNQIGMALVENAFSDAKAAVWSPIETLWPKPDYLLTLGLSENGFKKYQSLFSTFNLFPPESIVFNPGDEQYSQTFIQSLAGFEIEWEDGLSEQQRDDLFNLMVIISKQVFQNDLPFSSIKNNQLDQWRKSSNPIILDDLGIHYVLCEVKLTDPTIEQCPSGIKNDSHYQIVSTWNLDVLYEKFILYKIIELK